MLLRLVSIFLISFSAFADSLTYPSNADFSDIFKGYGIKKEGVTIKKLDDDLQPLSKLNCSETLQIAALLPDDFNKLRKFEIIPNDKSLYSGIIAKCILEKILILIQSSDDQKFVLYNALGNRQKCFPKEIHPSTTTTSSSSSSSVSSSSEISQDPEEQQLQEWLNYDISGNR